MIKNSSEYKKFLKFCGQRKVNFKLICETEDNSWSIDGAMGSHRARSLLDLDDGEYATIKPLPDLPLNYSSLYSDQKKMCDYALDIVTMNTPGGVLGEGNIKIDHKEESVEIETKPILFFRRVYYLHLNYSKKLSPSQTRQVTL